MCFQDNVRNATKILVSIKSKYENNEKLIEDKSKD